MMKSRCLLLSIFCLLSLVACKPSAIPPDAEAPAAAPGASAGADTDASAPHPPADTATGDEPAKPEMPSLQVTTLDGAAYDLAERRGKWVVINFWATWCSPCLKEMPELSALDALRENIEVIGLAYEEIEPEAMMAFLETHPVVYPIAIIDVYDPPADFATPRGLPMSYLIAPDGKVARQFLGPVTAQEIEDAIAGYGATTTGQG